MENKKAFTLIELVVVIVIISILVTIGFTALQGNVSNSRDTTRKADMTNLKVALKTSMQKKGYYPDPSAKFSLTNSGIVEVYQGILDNNIQLNSLENIPEDPSNNKNYPYSITANKQEFQIAMTYENGGKPFAYVDGDYKTVAKNIFPGLILAISGSSGQTVEVAGSSGATNRQKFILNGSFENLPYSFSDGNPVVKTTSFTGLISENGVTIPADTTFPSCGDILNSNKYKGPGLYDLFDTSTQQQVTTSCDCSSGAGIGNCSSNGVVYASCTLSGTTIPHLNNITAYTGSTIPWNAQCSAISQIRTCNNGILSGDSIYQYTICNNGTANNCAASGSYVYNSHTYNILTLNHGSGATISSSGVSEGSGTYIYSLSLQCNDGAYISINENATPTLQSCNSGYTASGSTCIPGALAYSSGTTYSSGQSFTYILPSSNSVTVNVTGTGIGYVASTKNLHNPHCDTDDIAIFSGSYVQVWAACNAGASISYTGQTLAICTGTGVDCNATNRYMIGDSFQWGRNDPVTSLINSGAVYNTGYQLNGVSLAGYGYGFIINLSSPYSWITLGQHNLSSGTFWTDLSNHGPCSSGYHIPTTESATTYPISTKDWRLASAIIVGTSAPTTTQFNTIRSVLRLPLSGYRDSSAGLWNQGMNNGYYWSSSPNSSTVTKSYSVYFAIGGGNIDSSPRRAYGFSLRCLKN